MGDRTLLPLVRLQGLDEARRAGNAMVDGVALSPEGERIAIEVKSPSDDIIRGVGQCAEALAVGYSRAVLVTTLRVGKKLKKRVFQRRRFKPIELRRTWGSVQFLSQPI
jgi:hypothetical protein